MQPPAGTIVGVGEVLWDLLPAGRQLGGAPFNFVFHCHQLGHPAVMVSRVGRDDLGREIRAALRERGLTDAFLQEDSERPTGTVPVSLGEGGQPQFTITEDVAFDRLTPEPSWDALFSRAVAVCFGTLVQRDPPGRSAVRHALALASNALTVYDVNLLDCKATSGSPRAASGNAAGIYSRVCSRKSNSCGRAVSFAGCTPSRCFK